MCNQVETLKIASLPTPLNLRRWHIQAGATCLATCLLCLSPRPTCHHVLNVALQQGRFTFRHDTVLSCLMAELYKLNQLIVWMMLKYLLIWMGNVRLTLLLPQFPLLYWSRYWCVLTGLILLQLYNAELKTVSLLELTCLFNSRADLSAARERQQEKPEYQQIVAELDRLGIVCHYDTVEIGCLGYYLKETVPSGYEKVSNPRQGHYLIKPLLWP